MSLAEAHGAAGKSVAKPRPWLAAALKGLNDLRCRLWDFRHGVDTCGEIPLTSYDFQSDNKAPGLEYHSHHPQILRDTFKALSIQHERYTFIDFGCGKGRALLVAAEFPFRKIVGLEFAPQLAQIAQNNVKSYRGSHRNCQDLEVLCIDATSYALPPEPQVLYFYSPFTGSVMERVVANIDRSLKIWPRDLFVLFSGVFIMRDRAFGKRPQYQQLRRERYFDLYRHLGQ